jgi:hypothetical protein
MAKRPDISVLLLFSRQVVRADFGRDLSKTVFYLHETVDVESTLWDAVEQVISGYPPLSSRTIILSSDVWSQVVLLPKLSVAGIEPVDLDEILKFEAETLSGIDIDEISLASMPLGPKDDFQQFWVSAIRKSDLEDVNKLLESVGCREIVIAHPAGLSGNQQTSPSGESIEIWDDLAFHLVNHATKLSFVKQLSSDHFESDTPILFGGSVAEQLAGHPNVSLLTDEKSARQWSGQVAANYTQRLGELAAPLIRRTKRTSATPIRHVFTGVIALAMVGFCFWHWQSAHRTNELLRQKIEQVKIPAAEKKKHDAQLIAILEQRAEVELEDTALGDDLKRVRFFLENQSNRFAKLLNLLIELRTDDLVVQEIGGTEDGVSISGISLNGESAQALAKRLRESAVPLGWAVNPARQEGQQHLTTGGPWTYEILLTDTGPFESAVQPRKKSVPISKSKP